MFSSRAINDAFSIINDAKASSIIMMQYFFSIFFEGHIHLDDCFWPAIALFSPVKRLSQPKLPICSQFKSKLDCTARTVGLMFDL